VSAGVAISRTNPALPAWRDPANWMKAADICAVLVAAALPWSTSLVGIFIVAFLVMMTPTVEPRAYSQSLRRPVAALPITFFVLAVIGMLWSEAPWGARLYAIGPVAKLLVLPALLYHYQRSLRGAWVFTSFLISCGVLMAFSWIVAFYPQFALKPDAEYGVPVKNYIDQSQEFALCAVALAYPIIGLLRTKRFLPAALLTLVALSFVLNMVFVTISRTALVTAPVTLLIFALLHLKWRHVVVGLCLTVLLGALVWTASPHLQQTTSTFMRDYRLYKERNIPTSIGLRLEFWKKSLGFLGEAPVIGHGTGSIRGLFEQAATGSKLTATGEIIGNPHNQTLNVAIQWGVLGIAILYAMWLFHLLLFGGDSQVAWIGFLVVVQNFATSLFNSHLFDFNEGWIYVLGVGIAGGMVTAIKTEPMISSARAKEPLPVEGASNACGPAFALPGSLRRNGPENMPQS
jgi:O-antigen ligase